MPVRVEEIDLRVTSWRVRFDHHLQLVIIGEGTGEIECDGKVIQVGPGAMMYCAGNALHGITNTGTVPMTFYWSKWLAKGFAA